ncbi:unnamed protein product [Calicophoron daubneyi]|uniref:RRM domain-containing protein n=1 Tax=Calicophoron daubneyi TaxID=300641 RepID=A0AAV2SXE5_CALDB
MAARDNRFSVFVGNLPPNTIQAHFDHIFPDCKMTSVRLIHDRETDAFKGFAYVDFEDQESLDAALRTDGSILDGYTIHVNHAQDRRGRGGRGPRGMGGGYGRGGPSHPRGNQDNWSARGRQSMGGGRFAGGGPRGARGGYAQRQSYHPPGLSADGNSFRPAPDVAEVNSNSSGDERPRLNLKPRTVPMHSNDERHLSERSKAIFGVGRPREASPVRGGSSPAQENPNDSS